MPLARNLASDNTSIEYRRRNLRVGRKELARERLERGKPTIDSTQRISTGDEIKDKPWSGAKIFDSLGETSIGKRRDSTIQAERFVAYSSVIPAQVLPYRLVSQSSF
jgi:hypothetical protein